MELEVKNQFKELTIVYVAIVISIITAFLAYLSHEREQLLALQKQKIIEESCTTMNIKGYYVSDCEDDTE